jgi:hypothetical protein
MHIHCIHCNALLYIFPIKAGDENFTGSGVSDGVEFEFDTYVGPRTKTRGQNWNFYILTCACLYMDVRFGGLEFGVEQYINDIRILRPR